MINVQWDLKQCATLSCFLFLCVPNGLNGLIARVDDIGIYFIFRMRLSNFMVSHLQRAYDTLLVVDPTFKNLWCIKEILRGFELALELYINFF